MFPAPVSCLLALTAVALVMHRIGVWATRRHTRARLDPQPATYPPLTLLKPIKGLEEQLEQNLRSFFTQDYPAPLQLVFASATIGDPGIAVARRVAAEYPEADVRFVVSDPSFGNNPKVANLASALRAARYDLVLQTDANVRIRPGYLAEVVREFEAEQASMLGSLVVGVGERSLGAALDNVQLTAFTTPGICTASQLAGVQCVIGKSMLFRRSELGAMGGIAIVKDMLAEDFMLGELYQRAGKKVVLSRHTVENVNVEAKVSRFFSRHSRWLKMRVVVHVPGFIADLLPNATCFAVLALLISGFDPRLWALVFGVVAYQGWLDARSITALRGHGLSARYLPCLLLRDLLLPGIWLYALCSRTTEWRGERFRLGKNSLLMRVETPLAQAHRVRRVGIR